MIELQTLEKLRPEFEIAWTYLSKPYIPEKKRSVYTRNSTANGPRNNGFTRNKINPPQRNYIVSYHSARDSIINLNVVVGKSYFSGISDIPVGRDPLTLLLPTGMTTVSAAATNAAYSQLLSPA
jgi:hypothetical protein